MPLTQEERERVNDSMMKIQSAARSLRGVNPGEIPDYEEIETCLEGADESLKVALRAAEAKKSD